MSRYAQIKNTINIAGSACLLLAGSAANAAPSWQDAMKYVLDASTNQTTNSYAGIDSPITATGVRKRGKLAGNQALIQSNLTTRQGQIRALVDADVSSGQLSAQTAADIRSQIAQLSAMQSTLVRNQGGLTDDQTQQFVDALGNITVQLTNATTSGQEFALNGNLKLGYNQALLQGNLTTRETQLRTQIEAARISGRVSTRSAAAFLAQVEQIAVQQADYLRMQNGITDEQSQQMVNSLASITVNLNSAVSSKNGGQWNRNRNLAYDQALVQGNLTAREGQLKTRIDANEYSQRISRNNAFTFRSQVDQIAAKRASYVQRQGGLTDAQYRQLVDALTDIGVRMKASGTTAISPTQIHGAYDRLVEQQKAVIGLIDQSEARRRITQVQASSYRQQIRDVITQAEQSEASNDSGRFFHLSKRLSDISQSVNLSISTAPRNDYRY